MTDRAPAGSPSGATAPPPRRARRVLVPSIAGRPVPPALVSAGRQALRGYGASTAFLRPLPDFILIGAKRCGTTSFYFHALRHPGILPMFPSARFLPKPRDSKGPHYFDSHAHHGLAWYRGHFPSRFKRRLAEWRISGPVCAGEASPYYLYHPLAPQRVAGVMPGVKLIVLLRSPLERTYSHYREQRRNQVENLDFEAALEAEPVRTAGEEERLLADARHSSFAHEQQSYVRQSEYVHGLRRWLDHFPRESLLILPSELYYSDPATAFGRVFDFLGLAPADIGVAPILNAAPQAPMNPATRQRLEQHFAPYNAELEVLTGQRFPWSRP